MTEQREQEMAGEEKEKGNWSEEKIVEIQCCVSSEFVDQEKDEVQLDGRK